MQPASGMHHPTRALFFYPASRSIISDNLSPQPANPLAGTQDVASVQPNQQATGSSTNPATSVSLPSHQNLLVNYLREFKDSVEVVWPYFQR
jgi:hypothetical protein